MKPERTQLRLTTRSTRPPARIRSQRLLTANVRRTLAK